LPVSMVYLTFMCRHFGVWNCRYIRDFPCIAAETAAIWSYSLHFFLVWRCPLSATDAQETQRRIEAHFEPRASDCRLRIATGKCQGADLRSERKLTTASGHGGDINASSPRWITCRHPLFGWLRRSRGIKLKYRTGAGWVTDTLSLRWKWDALFLRWFWHFR
jgi:hypothetical protein